MITRRFLESMAMAIIGDSVLCIVSPQRHTGLWLSGPRWWRETWRPFVKNPNLTRLLGVLGLGFGLWLAWRQEPDMEEIEEEIAPRRTRRLAEAMR
jgi:hypothetical protein